MFERCPSGTSPCTHGPRPTDPFRYRNNPWSEESTVNESIFGRSVFRRWKDKNFYLFRSTSLVLFPGDEGILLIGTTTYFVTLVYVFLGSFDFIVSRHSQGWFLEFNDYPKGPPSGSWTVSGVKGFLSSETVYLSVILNFRLIKRSWT